MNDFGQQTSWAALPRSDFCALATAKDATSTFSLTLGAKTPVTFSSTWIGHSQQ